MNNHKHNHEKVGEALFVKMTLEKFNKYFNRQVVVKEKTEIGIEELGRYGISAGVPFIIDEDTIGDYDVICENGVEVRYYND